MITSRFRGVSAVWLIAALLIACPVQAHPLHGAPPEVIAAYRKDLENRAAANPADPQVWLDFGHFFNAEKLYQDGERCYRKALELDPRNRTGLDGLAVTLMILKKPEAALEQYAKILALDPADAGIINTIAYITGDLGRKDEEIRWLEKSLELNPRQRGIARRLELLKSGVPLAPPPSEPMPAAATPLPASP